MTNYERFSSETIGLATFRDLPDPSQRLIWLPFGGGTSRSFSAVAQHFPTTWRVQAIDPPGHLLTSGVPLVDPTTLCDHYLEALGSEFFGGTLIVGHSVGGLLAAHLTRRLEKLRIRVGGCIICGARPPNQIRQSDKLSGYSQSDLFEWWLRNIGVNLPTRGERDLFLILESSIRADIAIYESFASTEISVLKTPALILYGEDDDIAPRRAMDSWLQYIPHATIRSVRGRHLFVVEEPALSAAAIVEAATSKEIGSHRAEGILPRAPHGKEHAMPFSNRHNADTLQLPTQTGKDLTIGLVSFFGDLHLEEPDEWLDALKRSRPHVLALLNSYGAVLIRGLSVATPAALSESAKGYGIRSSNYSGGNSPRTSAGEGVYTSTEFPNELEITPHLELSYDEERVPDVLLFACAEASLSGGETPLVDFEDIANTLDPKTVERFERHGVLYIRHLHSGVGFGRSWKDTFETDIRAEVEEQLFIRGAVFDWTEDGGLVVRQRSRATLQHPLRAKKVWFNQAEQWHPTQLSAHLNGISLQQCGSPMPHDVRYGDGEPIEQKIIENIRAALWRHAGQFAWRPGDLLIVDNKRIGHARRAFTGSRRIFVAMGNFQRAAETSSQPAEPPPVSGRPPGGWDIPQNTLKDDY